MNAISLMPDTTDIESETLEIVNQSQCIQVVTHADYLKAGEYSKRIKAAINNVVLRFEEPKDLASKAHKKICALEKEFLDPLKKAKSFCDEKVIIYEKERKRIEQEELNRRRLEAEIAHKKLIEEDLKRQEEERLEKAVALASTGHLAQAEAVISAPIRSLHIVPPVQQPIAQMEKVEGLHIRTTYKAEVFELMDLVQAVAAGLQPLAYLEVNQSALNKQASSLKYELRIPGVRVIKNETVI